MKDTKTVLHTFSPAAFDEELWLLDRRSDEGWQLTDFHTLYQKYERDVRTRYRYAMDCQRGLSGDDLQRYRELFEAQGWALVCRCRDWYIFRKPYDPALPPEEYVIYTDEPSLREMKRSVPLPSALFALFTLANALILPNIGMFLLAAGFLWLFVCDIARRLRLRRAEDRPVPYRRHFWRYGGAAPLALALLAVFWFTQFAAGEPLAELPAGGAQTVGFTVKLPDLYGLRLYVEGAEDPAVPYVLSDERGDIAAEGLSPGRYETVDLFLRPGGYTLTLDLAAPEADAAVCRVELGNRSPLAPRRYIAAAMLAAALVLLAVIIVDTARKLNKP